MAGPSEHVRGEMDITEQQATFHLVMGMTKWGSLAVAAGLLFLVLLFCTSAGFLGAAAAGVIVTALGIILLREKPQAAH